MTAGTILEGNRTPLLKWAYAIHLVARSAHGVNAVQLQSLIGVTYKTAWTMLNKIRLAISADDKERPLSGVIHAGFALCGKLQPSTLTLTDQEHPVIFAAAEEETGEPPRIKIKVVSRSHARTKSLSPTGSSAFLLEHTDCAEDVPVSMVANSRIRSRRLPFLHETMKSYRAWANLMFHGLGPKRLQGYLDEFCFRYNDRSRHIADRLTGICMKYKPA